MGVSGMLNNSHRWLGHDHSEERYSPIEEEGWSSMEEDSPYHKAAPRAAHCKNSLYTPEEDA